MMMMLIILFFFVIGLAQSDSMQTVFNCRVGRKWHSLYSWHMQCVGHGHLLLPCLRLPSRRRRLSLTMRHHHHHHHPCCLLLPATYHPASTENTWNSVPNASSFTSLSENERALTQTVPMEPQRPSAQSTLSLAGPCMKLWKTRRFQSANTHAWFPCVCSASSFTAQNRMPIPPPPKPFR